MASKEIKIIKQHKKTKQVAAGTTDITLTIPETLQIIRNRGNATS
jgi:hypothetical protein